MATYSKVFLSGGANGIPIKVVQTATAGTTIHAAHATSTDEIWIWAFNTDSADRKLTIEFGGATAPDFTVEMTIPFEDGPYLVIPGWCLSNSLTVKAFCATANVVSCAGFVNRITP